MKRSAGVLPYKIDNNEIKVLLCHFGGPYWEGIDNGAWTVSKGEKNVGEKLMDTAKREFKEETDLEINTPLLYLGSKKVSRNKLAVMFYTEADFDLTNCKSNMFQAEYPYKSGKIQSYPEMDKYEWMSTQKAKEKIIHNQLFFIEKLEQLVNR